MPTVLGNADVIGGVTVTIGADLSGLKQGEQQARQIASAVEKITAKVKIVADTTQLKSDMARLMLPPVRVPVLLDFSGAAAQLGALGGGQLALPGGGGGRSWDFEGEVVSSRTQRMLPGPWGWSYGSLGAAGATAAAKPGIRKQLTDKIKGLKGLKATGGVLAAEGFEADTEALLEAFSAATAHSGASAAEHVAKGQEAIKSIPFVGGLISRIGTLSYRQWSSIGNAIMGRGFKSDLGYAEDMAETVKAQDEKTERMAFRAEIGKRRLEEQNRKDAEFREKQERYREMIAGYASDAYVGGRLESIGRAETFEAAQSRKLAIVIEGEREITSRLVASAKLRGDIYQAEVYEFKQAAEEKKQIAGREAYDTAFSSALASGKSVSEARRIADAARSGREEDVSRSNASAESDFTALQEQAMRQRFAANRFSNTAASYARAQQGRLFQIGLNTQIGQSAAQAGGMPLLAGVLGDIGGMQAQLENANPLGPLLGFGPGLSPIMGASQRDMTRAALQKIVPNMISGLSRGSGLAVEGSAAFEAPGGMDTGDVVDAIKALQDFLETILK